MRFQIQSPRRLCECSLCKRLVAKVFSFCMPRVSNIEERDFVPTLEMCAHLAQRAEVGESVQREFVKERRATSWIFIYELTIEKRHIGDTKPALCANPSWLLCLLARLAACPSPWKHWNVNPNISSDSRIAGLVDRFLLFDAGQVLWDQRAAFQQSAANDQTSRRRALE